MPKPALLLAAMALGLAARLLLVVYVAPATDVYYVDAEAARVLLLGQNPYVHTFTSIPPALATPGSHSVYVYLPVTAIFLLPFYLLGDVRLGLIAADIGVAAALLWLGGRRASFAASLYLLLPFVLLLATVYANDALVAMLFIALSMSLEARGRHGWSALMFAVALAAIQWAWLLLPFFAAHHLRRGRAAVPIASVAAAVAIMSPFLIAAPSKFLGDVILFQFARSALPLIGANGPLGLNLNPSLTGFSLALTGTVPPYYLKAAVEVALLAALMWWPRRRAAPLLPASIFVMASALVLPNDFFWAYAELPLLLVLAWFSFSGRRELVKEIRPPKT